MQSRTYHTQQMAGSGVAAVFNWGSPAPTSSALGSWGGPSIFGGGGATGGGIGSSSIASSGFSSSYAGPSSLISDTGLYKRQCTSVRQVAANVDKNAAFRPYMEDGQLEIIKVLTYSACLEFTVKDGFGGSKQVGLFAIFDGHGGKQASQYCVERIPQQLNKQLKKGCKDLFKAFDTAFVKVNDQLRLIDAQTAGTTALVCLIVRQYGNPVLYTANVGDSRCVLKRGRSGCLRLSTDHRPCERQQLQRIAKVGGIIMGGRVGGSLAITRALGDHILYKSGVIPNPSISRHQLKPNETSLILASDGVWDVLSDQEAVSLIQQDRGADTNVKELIKQALIRGSKDNISCIVVHF